MTLRQFTLQEAAVPPFATPAEVQGKSPSLETYPMLPAFPSYPSTTSTSSSGSKTAVWSVLPLFKLPVITLKVPLEESYSCALVE